ncbi:hypothetical protein OIO90_006292 [Microbotryomycetes sp. JL221]|nr:hypothetical protein OIO90_006292 [Microbotryomycetes sp. JL221]
MASAQSHAPWLPNPQASSSRSSSPSIHSPSEQSTSSSVDSTTQESNAVTQSRTGTKTTTTNTEFGQDEKPMVDSDQDELESDEDIQNKPNPLENDISSTSIIPQDSTNKKNNHLNEDFKIEFENLKPQTCMWEKCGESFWEMEPFVEHILEGHTLPPAKPGRKQVPYICRWVGCTRFGQPQNSRFAILNHMRSHTGEKPFICPIAECDKTFTRTDALLKHLRHHHGQEGQDAAAAALGGNASNASNFVAAAAVAAAKEKSTKNNSKKRKTSIDSDEGGQDEGDVDFNDESSSVLLVAEKTGRSIEELLKLDQDELDLLSNQAHKQHEGFKDGWAMLYVVLKAKHKFALQQHEELLNEVEGLGTRRMELEGQCDELLEKVLSKEINDESRNDISKFMHEYNHVPPRLPDGFIPS